ncbi:MAG: Hpt domain-containing protein [Acidobacteriota bacterium]
MAIPDEAVEGLEERLKALDTLASGRPGLRTLVIQAFLRQGEDALATIRRALLQRDGDALAEAAHGLYGSAALLGVHALAESVGELATLARQGNLEGCEARLPWMESAFRDAAGRMK